MDYRDSGTPRHPRRLARSSLVTALLAILLPFALVACGTAAADHGNAIAISERGGDFADTMAAPAAAQACPSDAGLKLPTGFCSVVFADSLGGPRHLTVREDGAVFVVRQTGPNGQPGVVAMRDTDGDGKADIRESFGPLGGTGIRLVDDQLYVDAQVAILRYQIPSTALKPSGAPDTVVSGLPPGGHVARNFVFDGDGGMIVNFGSNSNACQEKNRGGASPGMDPCVELGVRAGLWRFDATRTGQKVEQGEHYAVGIRNAVAMEVAPGGQLWVAQHGRDQLFQDWGTLYTEQQGAENPGEELLQVNRNDDFGWPYCYFDLKQQKMVLAPEYGGDGGKAIGRCAQVTGPVVAFPAHWAPNGLLFYTGSQFPARYRDGVFIAFHGSWNRAPLAQGGYNVVFQPLRDGRPSGAYEIFADGFAGSAVTPSGAAHRPTGLAEGPDGEIYVSDDKGGTIFRITYQGR